MSIIADLLCDDDFIGGKTVWLQDDRKPFFFIDIFLFHVHSTVSFFSKLVIPVHVSMEEPVFKTKVESKSTFTDVLFSTFVLNTGSSIETWTGITSLEKNDTVE